MHTSIHHDGRARQDLSSPNSGLHRKVDDLIGLLAPASVNESPLRVLSPLLSEIVRAFEESHTWVDRVYELEADIRSFHDGGPASESLREFTQQRWQRAVDLTADLVLTAWTLAQEIEVDSWARPADGETRVVGEPGAAVDVE